MPTLYSASIPGLAGTCRAALRRCSLPEPCNARGLQLSAAPQRRSRCLSAAAFSGRECQLAACSPMQPHNNKKPGASATQRNGCSVAAAALPAVAAAVAVLVTATPALAFEIHAEPSNALSLPTWAVHTSSVLEWITAMLLMWRYGEVSGNPRWKGMAWGMLPCLGSAMCACTWHFFYNSPDLEFLVALQAFLTVLGNFTCWWAAYRIYQSAQQQA